MTWADARMGGGRLRGVAVNRLSGRGKVAVVVEFPLAGGPKETVVADESSSDS